MRNLLIIGGGQAAIRAALSLRDAGYDAAITLAGDEPHAPYERPPLSKDVLLGQATPASCAIASPDRLTAAGLQLHLGQPVVALRPGQAMLADGSKLAFDTLLLATGARPRRLSLPGGAAAGIFVLRSLDDAAALREAALHITGPAVVIGGGFLGLEAAASLRGLGLAVTVLESQPQLLHGRLPPPAAAWLMAWHERHGVTIRLAAQPSGYEVDAAGHVAAVQLADGGSLPCQLVLEAVGAQPNTALAAGLGLDCAPGIMADAQGQTALPQVFAAGDAACWQHPLYGRALRLESWQAAQQQGAAVAAAMLGKTAPFDAIPWFWSGQHGALLHIAGLPEAGLDFVERRDPHKPNSISWFGLRQGVPRLVVAVNAMADARLGQSLIERGFRQGLTLDASRLADGKQKLRSLIP